MSAAFTSTEALRRHLPQPSVPECFEELVSCPPRKLRVDRVQEMCTTADFQRHDILPESMSSEFLDENANSEAAFQEALLDEASDIEVHPDDMDHSQLFFDDPQQVCELARKALHQSPYKELHRLNIRVSDNRIAIMGQTTSFFLKQMAQEAIRQAAPNFAVDNLIGVRHLAGHCPPPPH